MMTQRPFFFHSIQTSLKWGDEDFESIDELDERLRIERKLG